MDCTSLLDGIRNYFATITAEPVSREQIQQSVILLYNLERWRERMVYTATALLTRNHTAAVRTILESIANVERNARARRLFFVLALGWRRLLLDSELGDRKENLERYFAFPASTTTQWQEGFDAAEQAAFKPFERMYRRGDRDEIESMRKGLNESILLQGLKEWIGQIAGLAEAHQILLPRLEQGPVESAQSVPKAAVVQDTVVPAVTASSPVPTTEALVMEESIEMDLDQRSEETAVPGDADTPRPSIPTNPLRHRSASPAPIVTVPHFPRTIFTPGAAPLSSRILDALAAAAAKNKAKLPGGPVAFRPLPVYVDGYLVERTESTVPEPTKVQEVREVETIAATTRFEDIMLSTVAAEGDESMMTEPGPVSDLLAPTHDGMDSFLVDTGVTQNGSIESSLSYTALSWPEETALVDSVGAEMMQYISTNRLGDVERDASSPLDLVEDFAILSE